MKRAGLIVGAVTSAVCLWASGPAGAAISVPCAAAVTKAEADALATRAAYVAFASALMAGQGQGTTAATARTAAVSALRVFIADIAALKTACAKG